MASEKKGLNLGCTSIGCLVLFGLFGVGLIGETHGLAALYVVPGFALLIGLAWYVHVKNVRGGSIRLPTMPGDPALKYVKNPAHTHHWSEPYVNGSWYEHSCSCGTQRVLLLGGKYVPSGKITPPGGRKPFSGRS
jgi:hypothetical protein